MNEITFTNKELTEFTAKVEKGAKETKVTYPPIEVKVLHNYHPLTTLTEMGIDINMVAHHETVVKTDDLWYVLQTNWKLYPNGYSLPVTEITLSEEAAQGHYLNLLQELF